MLGQVRLWAAGVLAAVAATVLVLYDAFRRGAASERGRQARAAEEARLRAERAAGAYERDGGAAERLRRGDF